MASLFAKRQKASLAPAMVVRFVVQKHSWRGTYRRVLCISPTEIFTQDPAQSYRVTNSYSIGADADIDGLTLGPGPDDFTLLARADKKTRSFKPLKFSCRQRAALLTAVYQCIMGVTGLSNAGLAYKLLSSPETFPCSRWSRKAGAWQAVTLQLNAFQVVCMAPDTGVVLWRAQYQDLTGPQAILALTNTASSLPAPDAAQADPNGPPSPSSTPRMTGVFALTSAGKALPRLLACPSRDTLLSVLLSLAGKRLGVDLRVETSTGDGHALLQRAAVANQQLASQLCDAPLQEWEVSAVRPRRDILPALWQLYVPYLLARPPPPGAVPVPGIPPAHYSGGVPEGWTTASRRLVLTPTHLVTRKTGCYSLVTQQPLAAVAALVRFVEDPQLWGVEWADGSLPSLFQSPARDAVLAAVMDAAQIASGAPVPILPGVTSAADMVQGVTNVRYPTPAAIATAAAAGDVARWAVEELVGRARDALPTLQSSSRMLFTADIEFKHQPYSFMTAPTQSLFPSQRAAPPTVSVLAAVHAPPAPHPVTLASIAEGSVTSTSGAPHLEPEASSGLASVTHLAGGAAEGAHSGPEPSSHAADGGAPADAPVAGGAASEGGAGTAPTQPTATQVQALQSQPPAAAQSKGSIYGPDGLLLAGRGAMEPGGLREAVEVVMEEVADFNSATPYSGVPVSYRLDSTAAAALLALLPPELQAGLVVPPRLPPNDVKHAVLVLQCLQRFAASHYSADTILASPGAIGRLFAALSCHQEHIAFEASRLLLRCTSSHTARVGAVPWRTLRGGLVTLGGAAGEVDPCMVASNLDLELAKNTKAVCFAPSVLLSRVTILLEPLKFERPPCSPLMSLAAVELITSMVSEPGNATTDTKLLSTLLGECSGLGRPLFTLFHHPAARVADGVAVLMRAIAGSGTAAAAPMREAALREGAMLHHLLLAAASASSPRTLLSRDLVASWSDEYAPALALLKRVFPPGLMRFLNAPRKGQRGVVAATPPPPLPPAAVPQPPHQPSPAVPVPAPHTGTTEGGVTAPGAPQQQQQQQQQPAAGGVGAAGGVPGAVGTPPGVGAPALAPSGAPPGVVGTAPVPAPAVGAASTGVSQGGVGPGASAPAPPPAPGAPTDGGAQGVPSGAPQSPGGGLTPPPAALAMPMSGGLRGNWEAFWEALVRDHSHAGLVWHESCRRELRGALQVEESALRARRQQVAFQATGVSPVWNHGEFRVKYPSLSKHTCIGGIYVRLLLEGADKAAVSKVPNPKDFFQALLNTLLTSDSHLLHAHASSLSAATPTTTTATSSVPTLQSSALSDIEATQLLCVRAMTEIYHVHAGPVGPVEALPHLLQLMDLSLRRPLRHNLLLLLSAALDPLHAGDSLQVQRVTRANALCMADEGGVELLTDVVACTHEASDESLSAICGPPTGGLPASSAHPNAAAATHFLTATGHDGGSKEWYFYPQGIVKESSVIKEGSEEPDIHAKDTPGAGEKDGEGAAAPDATGRVGPVSKAELLQLWKEGKVRGHTLCWAEGCAAPAPLASIRELRWLVSGGAPVFSAQHAGQLALKLLARMADMQPAADSHGAVLQPLPRVLRVLGSPRCLPHIAQALVTRDPLMVKRAAALLQVTLAHHEDVAARLYRTGAFYFALSYAGSNLQEVASLLAATHLKQAHRGAAAAPAPGAPLAARSYLGHLLPESLLYTLDSYGPQAFADALCGESDTPELRWTNAMRWGRLLPQLASHLGDFPHRLSQNWSGLVWQYTPAPPVAYPELKDELWCHRYYLKALCDEVAFPDWPIVDHVQLLQSLLAEWRSELSRQPLALSETDACAVLGLAPGPSGVVSEEDMRRAYRVMARKYHPDKNPAGRPMFMKIQAAYERLQAGAAGGQGPQAWRIALILKAQSILFRRFRAVLAPYKYAGYPQLLEVLSSLHSRSPSTGGGSAGGAPLANGSAPAPPPPSSSSGLSWLAPDQADFTQAAVELCWRTVCASHLNADELARCGGVAIISSLFQRLVSAGLLRSDTAPTAPEAIVGTHLLRSIAGFAASDVARPQLAAVPGLLPDVLRCCTLQRAHAAAEAALVAVGHLCAAYQTQLMHADAMAYLIPLLFRYDITVGEEGEGSPDLPFTHPLPAKPAAQPADTPPRPGSKEARAAAAAGAQNSPAPVLPDVQQATAHTFVSLELDMVRSNEARAHNLRALIAAQVLGRLAGVLEPPYRTPDCLLAQHALGALLTHGPAVMLRATDPRPLLALLNTGQESAQIIWNAAMRDELLSLMDAVRAHDDASPAAAVSAADGGPGAEPEGVPDDVSSAGVDRMLAWKFTALKNELQVGGVYVRVYNENPNAAPNDVQGFCKSLVRYLYEVFVTAANPPGNPRHPAGLVSPARASDLASTLSVLRALARLLDTEPRLLGLLASKSAVSPMVAALRIAADQAFAHAESLGASTPSGTLPTSHADDPDPGTTHAPLSPDGPAPANGGAGETTPGAARALHPSQSMGGSSDWPAAQLAQASLQVMARLVSHAGCLEALTDPGTVLLLFHTAHIAPSPAALTQSLGILQALAGHASTGVVAADQAGALYLLVRLLHPHGAPWPWPGGDLPGGLGAEEAVLIEVAALLARLLASITHGTAISVQMQRLLPPALVSTLASAAPAAVLSALRGRVVNPELVWEPRMAHQAAAQLASLAHQARLQQATPGASPVWALPPGLTLQYQQLEGELRVGGVYCRLFLKDPQFPLKEPLRFGEGLAQGLVTALAPAAPGAAPPSIPGGGTLAPSELVLLLSASLVALLKHHLLVSDNLVAQGYVPKFVGLLAARVPPAPAAGPPAAPQPQSVVDEGGALLRLLHALAASTAAAEALAAVPGPPVPLVTLLAARAWGDAAEVLVLEVLKRVLAPGNRSRDVLVAQALQVELVPSLLARLDWQSGSEGDADQAVLRALTVDVLSQLSEEGACSAQVHALLDASPVWAAYRGQRHDLFMPSGAASEGSVAGLLTSAAAARFALPAPERLQDIAEGREQ